MSRLVIKSLRCHKCVKTGRAQTSLYTPFVIHLTRSERPESLATHGVDELSILLSGRYVQGLDRLRSGRPGGSLCKVVDARQTSTGLARRPERISAPFHKQ